MSFFMRRWSRPTASASSASAQPAPHTAAIPRISFDELSGGGGFKIALTEERGITLPQLGAMLAFFQEKICGSDAHFSRKGQKLRYESADLYEIVEHIVKPATHTKQCSYVELVARGPQLPKWFVSHWWGQITMELAQCLRQHASDRGLAEETPYWICAFAAIQWVDTANPHWIAPDWVNMYASNQWYDPSASPFQKAMRMAEGTISIIDSNASYFERVWCCYEIWQTVMLAAASNMYGELIDGDQIDRYKYDIYTLGGKGPVGLIDGLAHVDMRRGKHWWTTNKYHREKSFPIGLASKALTLRLELGEATQDTDRIHILNSIVGSANLDERPPTVHPHYDQLNNTIRGLFAAAVWRTGFESGEAMTQYGMVLIASGLLKLAISFDSCLKLDDYAVRTLAAGLPISIQELDLDFNGCPGLTDDGLEALAKAFPPHMRLLKLDLAGCKFSQCGMNALANALQLQGSKDVARRQGQGYEVVEPSEVFFSLSSEAWELVPLLGSSAASALSASKTRQPTKRDMEDLFLSFAGCGQLPETGMLEVIHALPKRLKRLSLNFYGCVALGDTCLTSLARVLPSTLTFFELRVARCPDISDAGVQTLAKCLPTGLQDVILDFRFCVYLTDASASVIAENLPTSIRQLEIDFVSCTGISSEAEAILKKAATQRHGLKMTFWGKDDFNVNM